MQDTEWPNIGSNCNTQRHTNNPLGFWVGTGGWGQWGWGQWGGVGVRGIRGVRVGDCVHTHSSYVISNPLGFWVGTVGGLIASQSSHRKVDFRTFFSLAPHFFTFSLFKRFSRKTQRTIQYKCNRF